MTNYHYKIDIEDTIVVEIGKELHLLYKMNVTLPDERASGVHWGFQTRGNNKYGAGIIISNEQWSSGNALEELKKYLADMFNYSE